MLTNALTEAGLTQSESSVYIALLELGTSRAAPIIQKTQLQMSVVHRALNSLIEKGLINFVMEGKHRVYQGTDPKMLLRFMDEKKQRIESILPELQKHRSLAAATENATVYKGINGIKEAYDIMINSGKEYITFGGGPPSAEVMGFHFWMNLHRRRIERKLPSRQVFDMSVKDIGGTEIEKLPLTKIRYLPADFAQFQETVIADDNVCIAVFSAMPYALLLRDAHVANGYRKHFESLWKNARRR